MNIKLNIQNLFSFFVVQLLVINYMVKQKVFIKRLVFLHNFIQVLILEEINYLSMVIYVCKWLIK